MYEELFNSTSPDGSPITNKPVKSVAVAMHGFDQSVTIEIPAFSVMYFKRRKRKSSKKSDTSNKAAKHSVKASTKKKEAVKKSASVKSTGNKSETKKTDKKKSESNKGSASGKAKQTSK